MNRFSSLRVLLVAGAVLVLLVVTACRMSVDNDHSGRDAKVDIKTPFGQLKVNTDVDVRDTGLAVYPGAQPFSDEDSNDKHGANVNISSSMFGVKVVVKEFRSDDSFNKVRDYYRKELQRYGNVLECKGSYDQNVGNNHGDDGPLTCDSSSDGNSLQLKVGTRKRQHVVGLKPDGSGTRFALVYVNVRGKDEGI